MNYSKSDKLETVEGMPTILTDDMRNKFSAFSTGTEPGKFYYHPKEWVGIIRAFLLAYDLDIQEPIVNKSEDGKTLMILDKNTGEVVWYYRISWLFFPSSATWEVIAYVAL